MKTKLLLLSILFLFCLTAETVQAQTIRTIAGGNVGDGETALGMSFFDFQAATIDSTGNMYIYDGNNLTVRKISAGSGIVSTIAGGGQQNTGDTIAAADFRAEGLTSMAVDRAGVLYIAIGLPASSNLIFRYDAIHETLIRIAGTGIYFFGNNIPALQAGFGSVMAMAIDSAGNIILSDQSYIRQITAATGIVKTIAGQSYYGIEGDGVPMTQASFGGVSTLCFDSRWRLYLKDNYSSGYQVRRIDFTTGIITRIGGYITDGVSGDGGIATLARLSAGSMAVDKAGNVFVGNSKYYRIRQISAATGIITTIAGDGTPNSTGDGGPASAAQVMSFGTMLTDKSGNLYIFDKLFVGDDRTNIIRKISAADHYISRFCGNGMPSVYVDNALAKNQLYFLRSLSSDKAGNLLFSTDYNRRIFRLDNAKQQIKVVVGTGQQLANGGNGGAGTAATISSGVVQVEPDATGNFYFTDSGFIRKVNVATGIISYYGGSLAYGAGYPSSGDGTIATTQYGSSISLAADIAGNLYFADYKYHYIKKVNRATGIVTLIAGTGEKGYSGDGGPATAALLSFPAAMTVDSKNNLYFVDQGYAIRKVDGVTGKISTVAGAGTGFSGDGGLAILAKTNYIVGLTTDPAGNLYFTDNNNYRIRKVDIATGIITTIAGDGRKLYNGDNIPAAQATLLGPTNITSDSSGRIYVADVKRIRVIEPASSLPFTGIIQGTVFYDNNANGIKDSSETFAEGVTVSTASGAFEFRTVTTKSGLFKMQLDTGTFTTTVKDQKYYTLKPATATSIMKAGHAADTLVFALQPIPGVQDLSVSIIPTTLLRPGRTVGYTLGYHHEGATITNAPIRFIKSNRSSFVASSVTPYRIAGDTIEWRISSLPPASGGTINVVVQLATPPVVNLKDTLFTMAIAGPVSGDADLLNDTVRLKQSVVAAYDPNDKTEAHGGAISPAMIARGEYLQYTIRFQNTGNDTAFNVTVRDTLSAALDVQSLRMIAASHNYQLSISGNKLTWTFNNIQLPDSIVNEKASHGYISFQVKALPSLSTGTVIANTSSIYFDVNAPVRTNTTITTVKNLPAPPARPGTDLKNIYCPLGADQRVQLVNFQSAYQATVSIDSVQPAPTVAADGSFVLSPSKLKPGTHSLRTEYVNETGYNFSVAGFTVSDPTITPVVSVIADKTTLTSATDIALVSASSSGGGSNPLYAFSLSKGFSPLLQAESALSVAPVSAAILPNTVNTIYVRMKSSDTCLNNVYAYDSIRISKNNISTGITDLDNPGVVINAYPNPAAGSVTIVGLSPAKKYSIRLSSQAGSVVQTLQTTNANRQVITTSQLATGTYWISIYDARKNFLIGTMQVFKK